MTKPALPPQTYRVVTYGCQMNEYDSNMIAQMFEDHGAREAEATEDADFVVVNTCSIREKAEDTAFANIRKLLAHKRKEKPDQKIAIVGCMAKNKGEGIPDALKGVDLVLGPDNYNSLERVIWGEEAALPKGVQVITEFDEVENYMGKTAKISSPHSTFVTIQRGCNKRCTYCIVPYVRGNEKYRPLPEIVEEVKKAVDLGVTEVTLLGQTVNSYRFEGNGFADVLAAVSDLHGVKRIRFTSPHPKHFTDDVIWIIKDRKNICNYMHLPLQSGSDAMLKEMRRQYTAEEYLEIVYKLRSIDPDFALSTDVIAGFVGETEADLQATMDLMAEVRFDSAFMFAYSPREGTRAFREVETLTEQEKLARLQRVIDQQNRITFEINQGMIGKVKEILIEGDSHRSDQEVVGKTECFKKVILPKGHLKPGDYVQAKINSMVGWTLKGELAL
jgi:tRNA-2-methylthio-N6-dimethylallyladenosine synthase